MERKHSMTGYKYLKILDANFHKQYQTTMKERVWDYSLMYCRLRMRMN